MTIRQYWVHYDEPATNHASETAAPKTLRRRQRQPFKQSRRPKPGNPSSTPSSTSSSPTANSTNPPSASSPAT